MKFGAIPLSVGAVLHIGAAIGLWRWSSEVLTRVDLAQPQPEWWVAVAGAAMAGWGCNQLASAASGSRVAMLAAAVGELAAGTMLLGLWILNDLWQLGVAGAVEIVLGIWAGYAALAAPADA